MHTASRYSAILIWLQWTCSTALPLAAGLSYLYIHGAPSGDITSWYMAVFTLIGILQWAMVLYRYFNNFAWWIGTTSFGWFLAGVIWLLLDRSIRAILGKSFFVGFDPAMVAVGSVIAGAVIGISIGGLQYLLLRDRLKGAIWWLPANILGFGIGYAIISQWLAAGGGPNNSFMPVLDRPIILTGTILGSIVVSIVTATAMTWLLLHNRFIAS